MAISDVVSLVFTLALCVGVFVGAIVLFRKISTGVEQWKASMRDKGLKVSSSGVSIQTKKRFDQETYVDATQRGLFKAASAATYGPIGSPDPVPVVRTNSYTGPSTGGTDTDTEEGKRKRVWKRNQD